MDGSSEEPDVVEEHREESSEVGQHREDRKRNRTTRMRIRPSQ